MKDLVNIGSVAWWHQAITWTITDFWSITSGQFHRIAQDMIKNDVG